MPERRDLHQHRSSPLHLEEATLVREDVCSHSEEHGAEMPKSRHRLHSEHEDDLRRGRARRTGDEDESVGRKRMQEEVEPRQNPLLH